MTKKRREKLKPFEPIEGQHPVYTILDYYESVARAELKKKGEPEDLFNLMKLKHPSDTVKNLRSVLWAAERVREDIERKNAESAAHFMYRLSSAVYKADFSLRPEARKGKKNKDREWLEAAIRKAMEARNTKVCKTLWRYFKVNHHGRDNALDLEPPVYGSVYFQNDNLIFDDNDKPDPITESTFQKKLTELKKNPT